MEGRRATVRPTSSPWISASRRTCSTPRRSGPRISTPWPRTDSPPSRCSPRARTSTTTTTAGGRDLAALVRRQRGVRLHSVHAPITEFLHGTTWGPPFSTGAASAAARDRAIDECRRALAAGRARPVRLPRRCTSGCPTPMRRPAATTTASRCCAARRAPHRRPPARASRIAVEVIPNALSTAEAAGPADRGRGPARRRHLPGRRTRPAAGRRRRCHRDGGGVPGDDPRARQPRPQRRPPAAVRRRRSTGRDADAFQKVGYDGTLVLELAAGADGAARHAGRATARAAARWTTRSRRGDAPHSERRSRLDAHGLHRGHRALDGQEVTLRGWLHNRRSSGKIHFLIVRDGTGFIQVVMSKADVGEELFAEGRPPGAGNAR